jgi:hypothetical protein
VGSKQKAVSSVQRLISACCYSLLLTAFCLLYWLGREDSNLRMAAPKAAALPLGDSPVIKLTRVGIQPCLRLYQPAMDIREAFASRKRVAYWKIVA